MGSGTETAALCFLSAYQDRLFIRMKLPGHIAYAYRRLKDLATEAGRQVLSDSERKFLEEISNERRRQTYIAGRIVARELAGRVLDCQPADVDLRVNEDGSLDLYNTSYGNCLAHTHEGVCAAVADKDEVGIDLETIQPRHEGLYRFVLHPDEYYLLEALPYDRHQSLILC